MAKLGRVWPRHGYRGRPLDSVVSHHMNMRKLRAATFLVAGVTLSSTVWAQSFEDRAKRDEVVDMPSTDPAMAAAFRKARATLEGFLAIAKNPSPNLTTLALKVRVRELASNEYFWVTPFRVEGEGFSGILNNEPRVVRNVKMGQTLRFKSSDVVDWMYYDTAQKRMYGNFTACALLTREPPKERAKAKEQYGLECDG